MRLTPILLAVALALSPSARGDAVATEPVALHDGWTVHWGELPLDAAGGPDWAVAGRELAGATSGTPVVRSGTPQRRTLWLRRTLPEGRFRDPVLLAEGVDQTLEVWVDGVLRYRLGDLDGRRERFATAAWAHLIPLPEVPAARELSLRIESNYSRAGVARLRFGPRSAFVRELLARDVGWLALGLMAVFVGLLELVVFLRWRDQRLHLPFGGFALAIGAFVLSQTSLVQLVADAPVFWTHVVFGSLYLMPIGFLGFVEELFGGNRSSVLRQARRFTACCTAAALGLAALGQISLTRTLTPFLALLAADALLAAVITVRAALAGSGEARILLVAVAAVLVAAANDILVSVGAVSWSGRLAGGATLAFLVSLGGIAADRFAEIHRRLRAYSEELQRVVAARTRELETAKEQLELRNRDLSHRNRLLAERAARDSLTHLLNHGAFMAELDALLAAENADAFPLCAVMVDLDHFKEINDHHGHQLGDEVLRQVAVVLSAAVREGDLAARYGGEEFALLLQRCSADAAGAATERLREGVAAIRLPSAPDLRVTASFGIATVDEPHDGTTSRSLVARADEALYDAKALGRDRVQFHGRGAARRHAAGE